MGLWPVLKHFSGLLKFVVGFPTVTRFDIPWNEPDVDIRPTPGAGTSVFRVNHTRIKKPISIRQS